MQPAAFPLPRHDGRTVRMGSHQIRTAVPETLVFKSENLYFSCMEESLRLGEKDDGKRSGTSGKEADETEETKEAKRKGVMPLIKTLSQTLKQDKGKNLKYRSLSSRPSRFARSGQMVFFRWRASIPGHSGLRISTIPLPVKRIRRKCSWTTLNF